MATLPEWLRDLEMSEELFDEATVRRVWLAVGAKEHLADALSHINLRWESGALRCHSRVRNFEDPMGHVGSLVLAAYRLNTFSTSRFLSLGRSCQGMSMAFMVGLDNHMAFTRAQPSTGEYYSHCYDLLDPSARFFICKTAVAAHSTDRLHLLLLDDDRMAKDPLKFVEAVHGRLKYLNDEVPELLFRRLAEFIPEIDAVKLESAVLGAAYHAASFVDRRVFSVLRRPMFQLCRGNIREQLVALRDAGVVASSEPILAKVQALLRLGYPMACVEQAFELLREAPWSILRWEQMHGAGAKQHQLHKGFTPATHACKTFVSMMLPMVRVGAGATRRSMDEVRLAALKRKQPQKAGGAGAFLKVATTVALRQLPEASSSLARRGVAQSIVKSHHAEFRNMPKQMQGKFHLEALAGKRLRSDQNQVAIAELQDKIGIVKQRRAEAEPELPPLRVACVGWGLEDLQNLGEMFYSNDFPTAFVEKQKTRDLLSPPPPSLTEREVLAACDDGRFEEAPPECPHWVRQLCRNRDQFAEVVLMWGSTVHDCAFFVLGHASQNPFWASFYKLQRCAAAGAASSSSDVVVVGPRVAHVDLWQVDYTKYFFEDSPDFLDPPRLVVPGLRFEGKGLAWSDAEAVEFKTFVENMPVPPLTEKRKKKSEKVDKTLEAMHPWTRRFSGKPSGTGCGRPTEHSIGFDTELDGDELKAVYAAVAEAKLELGEAGDAEDDDPAFVAEPRGGAWTKKTKGVAIDSYRGRPAAGLPTEWMSDHFPRGGRSATFAISKFGAGHSVGLCRVWCAIMQSWYSAWLAAGEPVDFAFKAADLVACTPLATLAMIEALPPQHPVRQRFELFRTVLPHRVD
jgi:hypothetical protein